ncbi:MAG: Cof-type HAD-IIB family hydrolase [Treponema sp.]|nr:Cof-type HAD-IIB family hydrolase [Treponema sp.]
MEYISLILTDLDGTLFRNDKSISNHTKQVISDAQRKGVLFGISTSRALVNAVKFLDGITPDITITNGGALAFFYPKKGERIKVYDSQFTRSQTRAILQKTFEVLGPQTVISIDNEHGLYSNAGEDDFGDKYWTKVDFNNFIDDAMKICIETRDKNAIEKIVGAVGKENVDCLPFSDIPWYKLTNVNATKEKAISALSDYLKIPVSQMAAFGDDFNDIGMLKLCGKGIAVGNAIPEVKNAADEICGANENDGVAEWIETRL